MEHVSGGLLGVGRNSFEVESLDSVFSRLSRICLRTYLSVKTLVNGEVFQFTAPFLLQSARLQMRSLE